MLKQAKIGLFMATALLFILSKNVKSQEAKGIKFESQLTWEQIKEKAKSEHKYIFLDCYATWCVPCKWMEKEVYSDKEIGNQVNDKFIAVKVQMDQTKDDNTDIKSWYASARQLKKQYKIDDVPTLLFFDPKGELVHRRSGVMDVSSFTSLLKTVLDPSASFTDLLLQYKKGTLKGKALLKLALMARSYKQDSIALAIAKTYRKKVLDKQPPAKLLTPEILPMFGEFSQVYRFDDQLIRYMYTHKEEADKGIGQNGIAQRFVDYKIAQDIIEPKVKINGKLVDRAPDWIKIEADLTQKFDAITAQRNVLVGQCRYYQEKRDWEHFIKAWFDKIERVGVNIKEGMDGTEINDTIYSIIFKYSNDPDVLKKSILYMEDLVKITPDDDARLDTYANILYKSGQKEKALEVERRALSIAERIKDTYSSNIYKDVIAKMEKGEITWE